MRAGWFSDDERDSFSFVTLPVFLWLCAKPMPAAALAGLVWWRERTPYSRRLALGLALSAVGDVLMELPGGFLFGLGVFLGAHLAYTAAFVAESRRLALARAVPFVAFAGAGWLALRSGVGALADPVALYVTAIAAMMWRAAACVGAPPRPRNARLMALGGAILFAVSDLLIGLDRFRAPIPHGKTAILTLYWLGQLGIAGAVLLSAERATATR